MNAKRFWLLFCCKVSVFLFLSACHSLSKDKPDINDIQSQNATVQMAQAATTISRSLTDLSSLQKAASPPTNLKMVSPPDAYPITALASIDWSGPIEPVLRQIAEASGYRLSTLGVSPAVPILVALHEKNIPLGQLIRNIDFQCGSKANVIVFSERRIIELRYARS